MGSTTRNAWGIGAGVLACFALVAGLGFYSEAPSVGPPGVTAEGSEADAKPVLPACTADSIELSDLRISREFQYGTIRGTMLSRCSVSAVILLRWTVHNRDGSTTVHQFMPMVGAVPPGGKYPFETMELLAEDATPQIDVAVVDIRLP
jgi:hypothetical protein